MLISNRNLTNSKTQRLLREAYAIPYSMSPCGFLCWALSEPLFETSCDLCIIMAVPTVETGLISLFQVSNIRHLFQ